ncbi:hypothetical protein BSL78_23293 [Apostichopus japonicus]|uniref:Ankyrin and armadillo repeat-containing protein n=1 Tax=Stichopus japonicus TaxID=307972 RepID=A0A2G8JW18_STIJA|nr:hypothetical protein BSL78_23293 [Apostichopus japonicus]
MGMKPFSKDKCVIVLPMADRSKEEENIDFREVHQILRELVMGLYCLNQVPSITLEANFDQSTSCQIPPAYTDTKVGQVLIDIDYMMKALWHGAYFPKEKRLKFAEKWRSSLNVNALGVAETKKIIPTEFALAGMIDITRDPDYATIYDDMRLFPMSKKDANQDKKLFMQYVDKMGLTMTWRQDSISQQDNVFLVDSKSEVAGIIKLHEDQVKRDTFERLQTRLQAHVDVIQRSLARKAETHKEMELMKLVSFLVPFLMGMRRRNKIPDIEKLLPPLPADDCKTERELPPLMLSPDFRCPNFDFGNKYFHLHGGIQVDIESDDVRDLPEDIRAVYDEIEREAIAYLKRVTDRSYPYQESYPLPMREINGKKYCFFAIQFETYYRVSPAQPLWVHAFYEKIKDLKPKRLPLADNQMHEQFKKRYNYKQAIKYKKERPLSTREARRGRLFVGSLCGSVQPATDTSILIGQGQDLNVRRFHLTSSVEMLNSESFKKRDSAVRSLEILTTSSLQHSNSILKASEYHAVFNITEWDTSLSQHHEAKAPGNAVIGAAVLCNMAKENESVCLAIAASGAIPILICLLGSVTDDIQSRVAIILADLARFEDNRSAIASQGGIPPLIHLLDSELEDVLVNAVNAIRVICLGNQDNQTLVAKHGGIEPLTEFLETDSDLLQAASAAALAAITHNHKQNQDLAIDAAKPLVGLLKLRNMEVQVKAAAALESLAESNPHSQEAILALDAPTHLIRLLKIWALDVKEQAACTLWALAGHTRPQQKMIAECIGISGIIDLIVKSERLKHVGCKATIALTRESFDYQNKIKEENGILPLVRILRSTKTSERVLLTVIQALGALCLGVANRNNKVTQEKISEEGAINTLVQLLLASRNEYIRVEIAITLGCIILGNKKNQELLLDESAFSVHLLLDLLYSTDTAVQLRAGSALATFAFNNTTQQYAIREAGGIRMSAFQRFLDSENEEYKAHAAFQIVVLARVIVDRDQVSLSAEGVTTLVGMLNSTKDETIILSGSLIASLAHTRAGIPDAIITSGAVDILITHLFSENIEVRAAAAVALGYLTYNRTATRMLLIATRNTPASTRGSWTISIKMPRSPATLPRNLIDNRLSVFRP